MRVLKSFIAIPPGETLRDELEERGWTQKEFAEIIDRPYQTVSEIVSGKKAITVDSAILFAEALGTSPEFWLNLESSYRLALAEEQNPKRELVKRKSRLFELAPVTELVKRKWINIRRTRGRYTLNQITKIEDWLCEFFEVSTLDKVESQMALQTARFRRASDSLAESSISIWLRKLELEALESNLPKFNRKLLLELVTELPKLSLEKKARDEVVRRLNDVGIHLSFIDHFPKTKLDGAVIWKDKRPIIGMTLRYKRIDYFWFTLMHELAHVVLHEDVASLDEDILAEQNNRKESEANEQAQDWLIERKEFSYFVNTTKKPNTHRIRAFAESLGIHPCIIAGRLQHEKVIPFNSMRTLFENID